MKEKAKIKSWKGFPEACFAVSRKVLFKVERVRGGGWVVWVGGWGVGEEVWAGKSAFRSPG